MIACGSQPSLLQQAEQARRDGEPIRAASLYRLVLQQQHGDQPTARRELAALLAHEARTCWEEEEELERCRDQLREALDLDADSLPARLLEVERGLAEERLTPQEAVRQLQQVVEDHPGNAEARLALAGSLLDLGDLQAALEQLHWSSRLAPIDLRPQVQLAEALQRVNPEDAEHRMSRLLALHPDSLPVLLAFARMLAGRGRFAEAAEQLSKAEQVAPGSNEVRWARRRLERQQREWDMGLGGTSGEDRQR